MPDHDRHAGPPALRPPSEAAEVEHAPNQPTTIDPEQVRQFQQFRQFQELMRQQGGQPPMLAPPAKPRWQRVLRNKLVRKLALLLIVALGAYFAYDYYFGDNDSLPASMTGGNTYEGTKLLQTEGWLAVRMVYQRVAENVPDIACGQFDEPAKAQFAANNKVATCTDAVHQLFREFDATSQTKDAYANPEIPYELRQVPSDVSTLEISSCGFNVTPKLGWFKVEKTHQGQWIITEHRKETCAG